MGTWPLPFESAMKRLLGLESAALLNALNEPPPVSIRLNPLKPISNDGDVVPWCREGSYLHQRPVFTLDPAFHQGCYYVQEASSMFIGEILRQTIPADRPIRALDCCAAPGGKSTHLLDGLHPDSLLVCNEVIRSRVPVLTQNLVRWGRSNAVVTSSDPDRYAGLTGCFDLILVDAPCSGEGMFRKDPAAACQWSPEHVSLCRSRQQRILQAVWPALRENGILIYSTCTWNEEEDEENLNAFARECDAESVRLNTDASWGVMEVEANGTYGYKFFPHRLKGEGFFAGVLRKKSATAEPGPKRDRPDRKPAEPADLKNLLMQPDRFEFRQDREVWYAELGSHSSFLRLLDQSVERVRSGLRIGEWKHGKFIPDHDLSMSVDLNHQSLPKLELDHDDAVRFLRKETVSAPGSGMHLVRHRHHGLGWANLLPGRMNNLLPTNWRIRMNADQGAPGPF